MKLLLEDIKNLPPELLYKIIEKRSRERALQEWIACLLTVTMTVTITVRPVNNFLDKNLNLFQVVKIALTTSESPDNNIKIARMAEKMRGTYTGDGPDGGINACAWMSNGHVIKAALGGTLGANPNWVPDIEADLRNGYGKEVTKDKAKAGDVIILVNDTQGHIGIVVERNGKLRGISTRSHGPKGPDYNWDSDLNFDNYYKTDTRIYRVLKVRK